MQGKAIVYNAIYLLIVVASAVILIRSIVENATEKPSAPVSQEFAALDCAALGAALEDALWRWYLQDLRAAGPTPPDRGPLPAALGGWEVARQAGEKRCTDAISRRRWQALLRVRRALESNNYLLSQQIGDDIAALRETRSGAGR